MPIFRLAFTSILSTTCGCSDRLGYLLENYSIDIGATIETPDGEFKVWDHPDSGKMLTSPSVGHLLQHPRQSANSIVTENNSDLLINQGAAKAWLLKTDRTCTITKSVEVIDPEYEHTYTCAAQ